MMTSLFKIYPESEIIKEEIITEKNWNEEWEKHVKSIIISDRIGIAPEWRRDEIDNEIKLIINPKMSFGTGHHSTTRLMCKMMEKYVKTGSSWIDAGTGTGVLAILAIKLGAKKCIAFDNNSWSIANAAENFERNAVSNQIELLEGDVRDLKFNPTDGIAANINKNLIVDSLGFFKNYMKRDAILLLSGILIYDSDDLNKELDLSGFDIVETMTEDEWISYCVKLKDS